MHFIAPQKQKNVSGSGFSPEPSGWAYNTPQTYSAAPTPFPDLFPGHCSQCLQCLKSSCLRRSNWTFPSIFPQVGTYVNGSGSNGLSTGSNNLTFCIILQSLSTKCVYMWHICLWLEVS